MISRSVALCDSLTWKASPMQWFGDDHASQWSYLAALMSTGTRLGGGQFGGYIIPRGPTGGSGRGTPGLLLKALALAGHGGKGLSWFEFGPEATFPGAHKPPPPEYAS